MKKMKISITETWLRNNFGKKSSSKVLSIGQGLSVRISPLGTIAFYYRTAVGGKEKTANIGKYPSVSLLDAKNIALRMQQQASNSVGCVGVSAGAGSALVTDLFHQYMHEDFAARNQPAALKTHIAMFHNHLPASLANANANHVSATQWDTAFRTIASTTPTIASKMLQDLKAAFRKATKLERLQVDKLSLFNDRDFNITQGVSERFFDDGELRKFFITINSAEYCPRKSAWFKLLLLTGCRKSELRLAKTSDFHVMHQGYPVWTVNNHKNVKKTRKPIRRVLSQTAIDIVNELHALHPTTFIYGEFATDTPRYANFDKHFPGQICRTGFDPFTIHSLRHTYISHVALLMDHHARLMSTGHSFPGMDRVYLKQDFLEQQKEGIERWESKLIALGMLGLTD